MPRIARERSRTSRNFALPAAERCERPRQASWSAWSDQPGRLAQGPEEKWGDCGRSDGFIAGIARRIGAARLGGGCPRGNHVAPTERATSDVACGSEIV